jgi:hypothetical protein
LRQYLAEAIRHLHLETTQGMSLFRGAEARALQHVPRMQGSRRKARLPGLAMASLIMEAQQLQLPLGIHDVIAAGHVRTPTTSRQAVYRLLCSMGYRHQPLTVERLLPRAIACAIHALERKGNGIDHDHIAAQLLHEATQLLQAHPDLRHHRPQPAAAALVYAAGLRLFPQGWIRQVATWDGFAAEYTVRDLWSHVLRPTRVKEVPAHG